MDREDAVMTDRAGPAPDRPRIGYTELAAWIDRAPQSLRASLNRRRKHVAKHGYARASDIPEPDGYRTVMQAQAGIFPPPGTQFPPGTKLRPWWYRDRAEKWARQTGKLAADGVTPLYYRERDAHSQRHDKGVAA
jgi:hypothetical protein